MRPVDESLIGQLDEQARLALRERALRSSGIATEETALDASPQTFRRQREADRGGPAA